ncbi:hypothetical protein T492DRAFT_873894 [Pavlovales sp. CCMP2436]|nr:hypothetical protein T492DRAFT_873894 [Pavlovales sp. CCMP2436]
MLSQQGWGDWSSPPAVLHTGPDASCGALADLEILSDREVFHARFKVAACTKSNCMRACMFNSGGDGCIGCSVEHCRPALIRCAGIPEAMLP